MWIYVTMYIYSWDTKNYVKIMHNSAEYTADTSYPGVWRTPDR